MNLRMLTPAELVIFSKVHLFFALLLAAGTAALPILAFFVTPQTAEGLILRSYALRLILLYLIIPSALCSFVMGFYYGFTPWGFFKYDWLVGKWFFTLVIIVFGSFAFRPWIKNTFAAAQRLGMQALEDPVFLSSLKKVGIWGSVQLLVLVGMVLLVVFKPSRNPPSR